MKLGGDPRTRHSDAKKTLSTPPAEPVDPALLAAVAAAASKTHPTPAAEPMDPALLAAVAAAASGGSSAPYMQYNPQATTQDVTAAIKNAEGAFPGSASAAAKEFEALRAVIKDAEAGTAPR